MLVEKVAYKINWKSFKAGYSFFIPCLDTKQARRHIKKITNRLQYKVITKVTIEDGIKGIRIWRV